MRIRGLLLVAWLTASLAAAQNLEGDWHASLEVQDDAPLRLALHVTREDSGALKATLDSIDEAGSALPVDAFAVSGDTVKFEMKDTGGFFEGRVADDGSSIAGSWKQAGETWPLNWERGEDPAVVARPLDPKETREKGRAYTEWFYDGKVSELWAQLSPVMQQALVTADKLREFRVWFKRAGPAFSFIVGSSCRGHNWETETQTPLDHRHLDMDDSYGTCRSSHLFRFVGRARLSLRQIVGSSIGSTLKGAPGRNGAVSLRIRYVSRPGRQGPTGD